MLPDGAFAAFIWFNRPDVQLDAPTRCVLVRRCGRLVVMASNDCTRGRLQTIAQDGLASVACESRPARLLACVSIVMDTLACYLVLTEASVMMGHHYS